MLETVKTENKTYTNLFQNQVKNVLKISKSSAKERVEKIKRIESYIRNPINEARLTEALYQDFRKPETETLISETGVVLNHAKYIKKRIKLWMRDERIPGSLLTIGTQSYIRYEPKGVCLIIAPWNYPFNLAIMPLLYAIAAGNAVILKPSEVTQNTSEYLKNMIATLFPENEVTVVEGGVEETSELLKLPFDHIFFTGSPNVGKIIMKAAANNLTSVTLELGGKSPVIIDETASATRSAEKLAWGKCFNGGQTCIAPDYALVHESKQSELIDAMEKSIQKFYNTDGQGIKASQDLCRIINSKNFKRIRLLVEKAISDGARIAIGGEFDESTNFISPTVLTEVTPEMDIMKEEIFGPVLPVMMYKNREEALCIVQSLPKPLSMYIESKSKKSIDYFIENTSAGGTVINDFLLGYGNPALPFGGINNSGFGKSFGKHGFIEFSNERGIIKRNWGTMNFIFPPYTERVNKIARTLAKWG